MTKVRVAALNQGTVRVELAQVLVILSHDGRYDLDFVYPAEQPIAYNRNKTCKEFLDSDGDFLLMIDDDQWWNGNPLDYVERDLDVVGFPTPVCQPTPFPERPIRWNMVFEPPLPDEAVVEIAAIGAGSLLIARRVLEHARMRAPFMDVWDREGMLLASEDLYFCQRVREAGFRVWAATALVCDHSKETSLLLMHQVVERCSS
jgi:hypothetical protein